MALTNFIMHEEPVTLGHDPVGQQPLARVVGPNLEHLVSVLLRDSMLRCDRSTLQSDARTRGTLNAGGEAAVGRTIMSSHHFLRNMMGLLVQPH